MLFHFFASEAEQAGRKATYYPETRRKKVQYSMCCGVRLLICLFISC